MSNSIRPVSTQRRELHYDKELTLVVVALTLGLATFLQTVVVVGLVRPVTWQPVASILVLGSAAGWGYLSWRRSRTADQQRRGLPDVLGREFHGHPIYEQDDVQWCAVQSSGTLTHETHVTIALQSCVEAIRLCRLTFDEEGTDGRRGYFRFPSECSLDLLPGEVWIVEVPLRPTDRDAAELRLYVNVEVTGPRAGRNRMLRRPFPEKRLSTEWQVLDLATTGAPGPAGGVALHFERSVNQVGDPGDLPEPTLRRLWSASEGP